MKGILIETEKARGSKMFHIVAMPDVEIDPETGKARAR